MPNVYPLQDDFSSGEITPRLRGKTRSKEYQQGLAFCENFEVTPQGSLEMRGGTQFVATVPDANAVLHTYHRALDRDVVVVVGNEFVTLYDRDGVVPNEGGNLLTDPFFWNGLDNWELSLSRQETVPIAGVGVRLGIALTGGLNEIHSFVAQNVTTVNANVIHTASATFVSLDSRDGYEERGRLYLRATSLDGSVVYGEEFLEFSPTGVIYPPAGTQIPMSLDFTPTTTDFKIFYEMSAVGNNTTVELRTTITELILVDTTVPIVDASFPTPISWADLNLRLVQTCQDTALNRMFFTLNGGLMQELSYAPSTNTWTFGQFLPVGILPIQWGNGDPYTCAIHQGRLWLGGNPSDTSTLWASETWNYDNFDTTTVAVGNDPLEFTLTSNGAIQWLEGLKFLLIGTDRGEVIGRSAGPVITLSDFDFPLEQTWGSAPVQPAELGNQVMFITTDFARVRSLYDGGDRENGYGSEDISITADHIAQSRMIDIAFQQNPDYHLSILLANGEIATATYYFAKQVNAWFRLVTADAISSITKSNEVIGTSLWVLVERIGGDGLPFLSLEVKNAANVSGYNLDSYQVQNFDDSGLLTGLDHLNGYECGIVIVDGINYTVLAPQTPVNGEIQLPDTVDAGAALVGIPYTATAITLPLEAGTNKEGTSQVQRRRFNEVFLRLFSSGIPRINGQRPPIRNPSSPMNVSEPLYTGDTALHQSGWNEGIITLVQDLPLPTNITAIFGKAKGSAV